MVGFSVTFWSINKRLHLSPGNYRIVSFFQFFLNGFSLIINATREAAFRNWSKQVYPFGSSSFIAFWKTHLFCSRFQGMELWFQECKMDSWWGKQDGFWRELLYCERKAVLVMKNSVLITTVNFLLNEMGQFHCPWS